MEKRIPFVSLFYVRPAYGPAGWLASLTGRHRRARRDAMPAPPFSVVLRE